VRPLAQHVLAVARIKHTDRTTGWFGDWSAYIDAVPGVSHKDEWMEVLMSGEKLPEDVARLLFPEVDRLNTDRAAVDLPPIPWRA
jgi:hypothetical protein